MRGMPMTVHGDTEEHKRITTKEELIKGIEEHIEELKTGEGDEAKKSVKSHMAYLEFNERFLRIVERSSFPELVTEGWELNFEVTEMSAAVYLQLVGFDDEAKQQSEGYCYSIYEVYTLIHLEPRMLTVEDYAQLHEVNVGTVRQWIRRGKMRKAQKIGKEWRIPEFVEPNTGKYKDGIFYWPGEKLQDLPPEFSFLNDYTELGITQVDSDTYKVGLINLRDDEKKPKLLTISGKEREKLELFLISNPFVHCGDGRINFEGIEEGLKEEESDEKGN